MLRTLLKEMDKPAPSPDLTQWVFSEMVKKLSHVKSGELVLRAELMEDITSSKKLQNKINTSSDSEGDPARARAQDSPEKGWQQETEESSKEAEESSKGKKVAICKMISCNISPPKAYNVGMISYN